MGSGDAGIDDASRRSRQGGADLYMVTVEPLDLRALCERVATPADGALASFTGIVRDNFEGRPVLQLEYEAYAPMAEKVMREIGSGLRERFAIGAVAIAHRTGTLAVGEASVVIVVSAPHRRAALAACSEAIEEVKCRLPVWKKEFFEDGEGWRANTADASPPADFTTG